MHSKIVGGSTAERVINCPGSVALAAQMPPQEENEAMREGTRRHELIAEVLNDKIDSRSIDDEKVLDALDLFDCKFDPKGDALFDIEARVAFPWDAGIFGTADVIGMLSDTKGFVMDFKFGDGYQVEAEENQQLMFYAAAALESGHWSMKGRTDVELVIIQPPYIRRSMIDIRRLHDFSSDLKRAVKLAQEPDAPLAEGGHCRFCPAKAICPLKTGAAERAIVTAVDKIGPDNIGHYMDVAQAAEDWASDVRKLTQKALEAGVPVKGWKLVNKRAQRSWIDEKAALQALQAVAPDVSFTELVSPAQAEKALKAKKMQLPDGLTVAVSSGLTIAEEADSRPAAVTIGTTLVSALSKLS
jgi:CRISPR/Cas system-associated exonuclease Cas4 (RecB family)